MTDIKTLDDDIFVDDHGMSFLVEGNEEVIQANHQHLGLFKGEWFLDMDDGMPYFQKILGKGHSQSEIEGILKAEILSIRGNLAVFSLVVTIDRNARTVAIVYDVLSAFAAAPVRIEKTL